MPAYCLNKLRVSLLLAPQGNLTPPKSLSFDNLSWRTDRQTKTDTPPILYANWRTCLFGQELFYDPNSGHIRGETNKKILYIWYSPSCLSNVKPDNFRLKITLKFESNFKYMKLAFNFSGKLIINRFKNILIVPTIALNTSHCPCPAMSSIHTSE